MATRTTKKKVNTPELDAEGNVIEQDVPIEDIYASLMKGTSGHLVSDTSKGVLHDRDKIPTPIPFLNCIFGGGLPLSIIAEFYGDPACFTGDTKIMTLDGKSHTFEELYNDEKLKYNVGIYGCNTDEVYEKTRLTAGVAESVYLSKYTDEIIELEIDGKYKIKCTADHPFLMRNGKYKKAEDLKPMDELMPIRRKMYSYDSEYNDKREMTIDCNSNYMWTHRLVAIESVANPQNKNIVHHLDNNPLNNHPSNLIWCTNEEHNKYHGKGQNLSEKGKATRFVKNDIRLKEHNEKIWKSEKYADYRKKIRERIATSSKNGKMVKNNHDKFKQIQRRKFKVLSFLNKMILYYPNINITVNNYSDLSRNLKNSKYKISLFNIAKVYDCLKFVNNSIKPTIDLTLLESKWNMILEESANYNHKVTKVTKLKLEQEVPVYGLVNAGKYHNYAIALDEEHGIFVSNSGKSSTAYQILGEFQKKYPPGKGLAIIVDTEASVDSKRMKFLGCMPEHIMRIPAGTVENGFETLYSILDKKMANEKTKDLPVFILWDREDSVPIYL